MSVEAYTHYEHLLRRLAQLDVESAEAGWIRNLMDELRPQLTDEEQQQVAAISAQLNEDPNAH